MLNGMPVFSDIDFAHVVNNRQVGICEAVTKQIGNWTVTLFADSIELWLEPGKFQSPSSLLTIIYRHWFDEPGIFINNRGATREQLIDIVFNSNDADLQNFFLFNQLL